MFMYSCNNQDKQETTNTSQENLQSNQSDKKADSNEREIVFKVNGKPYYKDQIGNQTIEYAKVDAILYEAAIQEGRDKDPEYVNLIERYKRNTLLGRFKGDIIKKYLETHQITDEELDKYYENNKAKFTILNLIKLSTKNKEIADKIYQDLGKGKSIEEIKSAYADLFTYNLDGAKNYNIHFSKLEPSEYTKPILEDEFYNIYVIDSLETMPLKAAKRSARYYLSNKLKGEALIDYTNTAKKEMGITVEMTSK